MPIPTTERRFREGSGEKYLSDGMTIRCHAVAKNQLRKYREDFGDEHITPDEAWPECQCTRAASPGAFACRWHGGETPKKLTTRPKSILDVVPTDLAEKLRVLMENPTYWSRKEDIMLMQARIWELGEELQTVAGSEEAWAYVHEAIVALRRGKEVEALLLLQEAIQHVNRKKEIWREIRQNENVIKELTNTQVRTVKDLKQMATTEQVTALVMNLFEIVDNGAKKYIDDPVKRSQFLKQLSFAINRYANFSPAALNEQVDPERYVVEGEALEK